MKSIITKLSSLLLCGVVALTGCTDFSADIQGLDKKLSEEIAALKTSVQNLDQQLSQKYATKVELEAEVEKLEAEMKKLQDEKADKTQIEDLQKQIDDAVARIELIEEALEELVEALQERSDEIDQKFADMDAAFAAQFKALNDELAKKASGEDVAEINQKIADLESAYQAADAAIISKIDAAVSEMNKKYEELSKRIDALEKALGELQSVLRSIVMVPELIVDGVNSVEFKSFVYVAMSDTDDTVPDVTAADPAAVKTVAFPSYAYYHFNPSTFDITKADYSVVSTEAVTKASTEPVATVKSVTKDGDKVKVEFERAEGTDNMFALAATLKADGAVVYSDYAQVVDEHLSAESIVIVDEDGFELNYTLSDVQADDADVVIDSDQSFSLADYVSVEGIDLDTYGLSLAYSSVVGDIKVAEDGTVDMTNIGGISIAKVELVDADGDVVRRAYVKFDITKIEVIVPGFYYKATAKATVEAARIAFEVNDIYKWLKALKDEPNTTEILKEVAGIAKKIAEIQAGDQPQVQKNYLIEQEVLKAYDLLNGVPGFVFKYKTISAEAEASAKVSMLPQISSVAELKAALQIIEEEYPQVDLMAELTEKIEEYIPASVKSNPIVAVVISALKNFDLLSILENDTVMNLIETGEAYVQNFVDYDKITARLEGIIKSVVGEANYGEQAAKIAAKSKAQVAAEEALEAELDAVNEQLLINFENGTWAQILRLFEVDLNLDNPAVAYILDKMGLTETAAALQELLPEIAAEGRELIKFEYESEDVVYQISDPEKYEVI